MAAIRTLEGQRGSHPSPFPMRTASGGREYLFISYAWEDAAFAEWLTLKLTALGYAVWCDRFQLLGGESYPRDIDKAIKERTFRVLGLLSQASIAKPNPVKERTLALNLGRERKVDFLIPLNVDGLKPTELDWMESDLTFISFHRSWRDGLTALLKKLEAIEAPRPLAGSAAVSDWFTDRTHLVARPERLWSNFLAIRQLPDEIYFIRGIEDGTMPPGWPAVPEQDGVWLFEVPDSLKFDFVQPEAIDLTNLESRGPIRRAVVNLLRQYLRRRCLNLGLVENDAGQLYFPHGLLPGDRLPFTHHTGRQTSLQAVGFKTFRTGASSVRNQHHLTVELVPRLDRYEVPVVEVRVRVYLTDLGGKALPPQIANRRRKRVAKSWFNHEWWSRYVAVIGWFAQGNDVVDLALGPAVIAIDGQPKVIPIGVGIDEEADEDPEPEAEEFEESSEDGDEGGTR
jgi:TIR domain